MDEDFEEHAETFEKSNVILSTHMSGTPIVMICVMHISQFQIQPLLLHQYYAKHFHPITVYLIELSLKVPKQSS